MKKLAVLLATVTLGTTLLVGCGSSKASYKDGTYTGVSAGLKGDITVEVTIEGGEIKDVVIPENNETETIFASIREYLVPDIIKANSADVETVSGATTSSKGVLEAVEKALEQAK